MPAMRQMGVSDVIPQSKARNATPQLMIVTCQPSDRPAAGRHWRETVFVGEVQEETK